MPNLLRPIRLLVPTLLAAFATAGCESSTLSSDEVQGTFVLETLAGNPVPLPLFGTGSETHFLVADTMRLGSDGGGTQVRVIRVDFDDPARPDRVDAFSTTFGYRVRGSRLEITVRCPPNALCAEGPHGIGRHEGDALVLGSGDSLLRYRRIED
jgi:hypothetical protein